MNVMWVVSDFILENGVIEVVLGSNYWIDC